MCVCVCVCLCEGGQCVRVVCMLCVLRVGVSGWVVCVCVLCVSV